MFDSAWTLYSTTFFARECALTPVSLDFAFRAGILDAPGPNPSGT